MYLTLYNIMLVSPLHVDRNHIPTEGHRAVRLRRPPLCLVITTLLTNGLTHSKYNTLNSKQLISGEQFCLWNQ